MQVFSVKQMQDYEAALFAHGLSPDILMENAGRLCAQQILNTYFTDGGERLVSVFCGPGGNGGDGLVLARCLLEHKVPCVCYIIPADKEYKPLVMRNLKRAFVCALSVKEIDDTEALKKVIAKTYLAVDALLGLGASAAHSPRAVFQEVVDIINTMERRISIDGPSGLDMDTGSNYLARPVKARETYTLGFAKQGLLTQSAQKYTGKLTVLDIFSEVRRHCK